MARKLSVAQQPAESYRPPNMREAVETALADMTWLKPSDDAMKALALNLAERIEQASRTAAELDALWADARGEDMSVIKRLQRLEAAADAVKMLGWLGPQLQGVLRDLGGAPTARKAMQPEAPVGGRLAALRAALPGPGQHAAEAVDSPES